MKFLNSTLFFSVAVSLVLSSCFKRDNTDWTFSQDNSISSEIFQDIYNQTDQTAQSGGGLKSCPNVVLSDTLGNFPNTATIDFGTGCLGLDGRTRSGVITAVFSGRWRDGGTTVTITLDNYSVNGYQVEGTATIVNNNNNPSGNLTYDVTVSNGKITDPDNNVFSWSGLTTYEWVEGQNTNFASHGVSGITDDVYHITGTANGVSRRGTPYTAVITSPLVRALSCRWITKGIIELTPQGGDVRTLDFGTGACDATVTFKYRSWTLNFLLP